MAAGGVACTGSTGEDYVIPGKNALVLETTDPWEFVALFRELSADPLRDRALRRAGRATAEQFSWQNIVKRLLLPRLHPLVEASSTEKLRPA
jgi:glycosyltransferase involved in cell wall biosynthesis